MCFAILHVHGHSGVTMATPTTATPAPSVEPTSQACMGGTQEVASLGRQDTCLAPIAAASILAVLFLLCLLITIVLILWVVRLNRQLSNEKGMWKWCTHCHCSCECMTYKCQLVIVKCDAYYVAWHWFWMRSTFWLESLCGWPQGKYKLYLHRA